MPKRKRSAVPALLQNLQAVHPTARRTELGPSLDAVVGKIIEEIASESERERRRFTVLRRSDILHEPHDAIAADVGLSRSQFYRDLHAARERLSDALDRAFSLRAAQGFLPPAVAARRMTVETLRAAGQHGRARAAATGSLREAGAVEAIELLCLRAELETESGCFESALGSCAEARALLGRVGDARLAERLGLACDLEEFEAAHCLGTPVESGVREACLVRLRARAGAGDRAYASLLVKALIGEASLLFGRGAELHALGLIDEAAALVRREPLVDTRLAIDVQVRVSGLHAARPDGLSGALDEAARIVDAGMHWRDTRTLRLGLQTMSAHLLTLGRLDEAKEYALQAHALIELFGSALDRAIVLSNLARIEIHQRDGARALEWVGLARETGCDAFPITQAVAISEAEALALVDQPRRALDAARSAGARVAEWPRLHARAKLAEAIALSALSASGEAQRCSSEAVELSRVAGGPLVELRALDLNVKLTGSAASQRALRDLRAALSAS
ncbi:MAG TPA: hypothetical protein VHR97_02075 [Candidatus Baltobacteraceae bacterium]|jgi:hypothetical protein|nr:hypothetical protein [Candidatus Baltobacteraceae bacterium]